MSAAQTDLEIQQAHEKLEHASGVDTPRHRALPGSSLDEILKASDKPLIAVDLDDVLSETNLAVAQCKLQFCCWLVDYICIDVVGMYRAQRCVRYQSRLVAVLL